jgi:hypothetical protein
MFKEGWIVVKGVPTHVLTWGGWIEDNIEGDSVFLCITGNPGLVEFYFTFLSALQELIKMPVWIVNLNGKFKDIIMYFLLRYPFLGVTQRSGNKRFLPSLCL